VSVLLTAALVGGGIVIGRLLAGVVIGARKPRDAEAEGNGDAKKPEAKVVSTPNRDPFALMPCRIGDVILRAGGEEAWLAGALVLSEDAVVAAMFVAPEAGHDRAIFVRSAKATGRIAWLEPLAANEIATGAEPPTSIEHRGTRFDRVRRLPVHVERAGAGAPDIGERAIIAEYATPAGDALVLLVDPSGGPANVRAWRGVMLEEGMYEVLPGGNDEAG
jgi:hypothetical protein